MSSETPSTSSSPPRSQVKKENEEEIKEFAETAMNELLGWYGYERLELRRWAASRAKDTSSPENANEAKEKDECTWCNKAITSDSGPIEQAGAVFCSEVCFSQSRRANFKRAKTCDWCRHVRHTVAYVDFQDGATQLQFCSDKCLNQYKMHIFCRETQAHLDLNPHLVKPSSSSNLITPDLWLKNCKSRSASPDDKSSSPKDLVKTLDAVEPPAAKLKSPLPLIKVASTAKLMKPKRTTEDKSTNSKVGPKKDLKNTKMNLRKRRSPKCSSTVTSQSLRQSATPKAQDLSLCSPSDGSSPVSTLGSSTLHSPPHIIHQPNLPPQFQNTMFGLQSPMFIDQPIPETLPMFPPPHFPRPSLPLLQDLPRVPNPINFPQFPQFGQTPPVTILVPHPVPIPIPFPIPIPIPMSVFLHAHYMNKIKTEPRVDDNEGPLDFTMNNKRDSDTNPGSNPPAQEQKEDLKTTKKKEDKTEETVNAESTLPKFKITRLGNNLSKIVVKPKEQCEAPRPLRKRRRLVDVASEDDILIQKSRKTVEV